MVNAAPIADAGPDLVGAPGQELTFAAPGSLDPDGDVAEYLWDFKDGAERERRAGPHTFDQPGIYQRAPAACATIPARTRRSTTTRRRS